MEMYEKFDPKWPREKKEAWARGVTAPMLGEQEQRKDDSAKAMDNTRAKANDLDGATGEGKIRVHLETDPQDLRPSPYGRSAEDSLGKDETGGERRQDYDLDKDK